MREVQSKTEYDDPENILKSFKIDNVYYRKKCESLNKKKFFSIVSEFLTGSSFTLVSSTL